ncbi:hypothetical protein L484_000864 [Morus notabilis]|uniref:Uncharacterized protein n=1 Tax=Morus notabilis TaxID=981085 RepID=W9T1E5_9ROSA|nr:hypothetical protein L484_000864 [Morus notabilis]
MPPNAASSTPMTMLVSSDLPPPHRPQPLPVSFFSTVPTCNSKEYCSITVALHNYSTYRSNKISNQKSIFNSTWQHRVAWRTKGAAGETKPKNSHGENLARFWKLSTRKPQKKKKNIVITFRPSSRTFLLSLSDAINTTSWPTLFFTAYKNQNIKIRLVYLK